MRREKDRAIEREGGGRDKGLRGRVGKKDTCVSKGVNRAETGADQDGIYPNNLFPPLAIALHTLLVSFMELVPIPVLLLRVPRSGQWRELIMQSAIGRNESSCVGQGPRRRGGGTPFLRVQKSPYWSFN